MLFAPFLWKGAIALRALLLLNTAPASRHLRTVGSHRLLLGTAGVLMLGYAMDEYYMYSPPVQPLSDDLPGLDFILDSMPKVLLLDAAPEVLLLDAAPLGPSEVYSYGSSINLVDVLVPELDWAVPETPTIRAPEADTVQPSDDLLIDIYLFYYPRLPADIDESFKPVAPTDDLPPMWTWEEPEALFERIVMKKGRFPVHLGPGSPVEYLLLFARGSAFLYLSSAVFVELIFIPGALLDLWKMYQEHRRRQQRYAR